MNTSRGLFSAQDIDILSDTKKWRFISSALPIEVEATSRPEHEDAWAKEHTDVHPFREVLFILSGSGYQRHCDETYLAEPGTILLFDSGEPHDYAYPPDHPPGRHLYCQLRGNTCVFNLIETGPSVSRQHFLRVWYQIYALRTLGLASPQWLFPAPASEVHQQWMRWRCAAAWGFLFAALLELNAESRLPSNNREFQQHTVGVVRGYIEANNGTDCSLPRLAGIAGYSKYHFSRMFQENTGMSVRECVNAARIRAFKRMRAQDLPLKRIAGELGFAHASALSRWRRQHGV